MTKETIEAIIRYVDAKVEYELASIERDEDGYMGSCVTERKAMEAAEDELRKII